MPRGIPEAPLEERFMRRVNKNGKVVSESLGNCWEWLGGKYNTGYGQLIRNIWGEETTHRWSYKHFHNVELTSDILVRHRCDNRICVNPNHLEEGTKQQNIQDMIDRHPQPCGRKFNKEQVEEILMYRSLGMIYKDIAEHYGVSRRTIEKLCLGKTY
jgi:uncharacterized protein (DUF433 family)